MGERMKRVDRLRIFVSPSLYKTHLEKIASPLFPFPLFVFSLLLLTIVYLFIASPSARAQTQTTNILPALAPLDRNSPIELIAATLDADLSENAGRIRVVGANTYKLHNTDPLNDVEIPLGFPTWSGGNLTSDPNRFDEFKVYVDERAVRLARANAALRIGNEVRDFCRQYPAPGMTVG